MLLNNFLIQLIGFLGAFLYFISFQFKENKNLFRVQLISYFFYVTHMLLLGAITGGACYIINGLRSYFLSSKWEFAKSKYMCFILCFLHVTVLFLTWGGFASLLPVLANIASTIGGYTKNPQKIRIANMFINSPLCIIYDIIVGSWAGIVDEVVSEVSMIVSIIRYGWKNLDVVEE